MDAGFRMCHATFSNTGDRVGVKLVENVRNYICLVFTLFYEMKAALSLIHTLRLPPYHLTSETFLQWPVDGC